MEFLKNQQIQTIPENELNRETIIQKLFDESEPILYIVQNHEYIGCITSSDFMKSMNFPQSRWINYNGCKLVQDKNEWDQARDIFDNHPKIHNVPVVDSQGRLLYEYKRIREDDVDDGVDCEFLKEELFSRYLNDLGFHSILFDFIPTNETAHLSEKILSYSQNEKKVKINDILYADYGNVTFCSISELKKGYKNYEKLYQKSSHQTKKWIQQYHELFGGIRLKFESLSKNINLMYEASMDYEWKQILNLDSFYWYLYSFVKENEFDGIASSRRDGVLYQFKRIHPDINIYMNHSVISENKKILYLYEMDDKCRDSFYEANKKNCWIRNLPIGTLLNEFLYSMMIGEIFTNLNLQNIPTYSIILDEKLNRFQSSLERDKRKLYAINHISKNIKGNLELLSSIFGKNPDMKYLRQVLTVPERYECENAETRHLDTISEYVNIMDGKRRTANQPMNYTRTVHIFGTCLSFGYGVEDEKTVASYLQNILNENGEPCRVVNYGIWSGLNDVAYYRICNAEYQSHDIIIWLGWLSNIVPNQTIYSVSDLIAKNAETNEYYDVPAHAGHTLNQTVAQYLYDLIHSDLKDKNIENQAITVHKQYIKWKSNELNDPILKELEGYKRKVSSLLPSKDTSQKEIGAIVMNANPFTLGHQKLMETAANAVDYLYVFVVEEDKSFFPFRDRFQLVQQGANHLQNVTILPSGKCIISSLTFSGYFKKEEKETKLKADVANDVRIFAKYIVPMFHIRKRFVGEEPFDLLTNRYNEAMKAILPSYGVEVIEIPRKKNEETVISASTVRKFMRENRWNEIKSFVPATTYEYLIKKFS